MCPQCHGYLSHWASNLATCAGSLHPWCLTACTFPPRLSTAPSQPLPTRSGYSCFSYIYVYVPTLFYSPFSRWELLRAIPDMNVWGWMALLIIMCIVMESSGFMYWILCYCGLWGPETVPPIARRVISGIALSFNMLKHSIWAVNRTSTVEF